jgi:hypothetical protein
MSIAAAVDRLWPGIEALLSHMEERNSGLPSDQQPPQQRPHRRSSLASLKGMSHDALQCDDPVANDYERLASLLGIPSLEEDASTVGTPIRHVDMLW